jgi:hypothetical protein
VLDSLYVIEMAMRHFFIRAEIGKSAGRKNEEVDADYKQAAALAALVTPYRHARLSAVKVAGGPNSRAPFKDDASARAGEWSKLRPFSHVDFAICTFTLAGGRGSQIYASHNSENVSRRSARCWRLTPAISQLLSLLLVPAYLCSD